MHHYRIPFQQAAPQTEVVMIKNGTHQLPPRSFVEFNSIADRFLQPVKEQYYLDRIKESFGKTREEQYEEYFRFNWTVPDGIHRSTIIGKRHHHIFVILQLAAGHRLGIKLSR
jgi:hypothetical protein